MKQIFYLFFSVLCFPVSAISNSGDSTKTKSSGKEYTVSPVEELNTTAAEFCAVPYQDGIVFVASQLKDLVNNESYDVNGHPYTDLFFSTLKDNKAFDAKPFSTKVNGSYHDGPAAFNADGSELYVTRLDYLKGGKSGFVNRARILVFKKNKNAWSGPTAFPYNSEAYSTAHATISKDGDYLFFVSDMPGGIGGKDLYVCKKNETGWDKPQNLGPGVNTVNDEEYPFIRKDGKLFFSSNGRKGFGGFDIFSAINFNGAWQVQRNEGEPLNSAGDDFGIVFADSLHGYFSSNRNVAMAEDIYRFTFVQNSLDISGTILLTENSNDPAKNIPVFLLDRRGNKLDSTFTDKYGKFLFKNLPADKGYMASVEPNDIELRGKTRFYMADADGKIVRYSYAYEKKWFVFRNLPLEKGDLPEPKPDDNIVLSGSLTYSSNPAVFIKNARLVLVTESGVPVDTVETNELGYFVFKNLSADMNYMVRILDSSVNLPYGTALSLNDRRGKRLQGFVTGKDPYSFKLLSVEKTMLRDLAEGNDPQMICNGENYPNLKTGPGKKVYLMDRKAKVLDSLVTDTKGFFRFKYLDPDKQYMVAVEDQDARLHKTQYYLVTPEGYVMKVAYPLKEKSYVFRNVSNDSLLLKEVKDSDKLQLAGNLRYGPHNSDALKKVRIYLMDPKGVLLDSTRTNENGCFVFKNLPADKNYLVEIKEADIELPLNTRIVMTDRNGRVIRTFYTGKDKFQYKIFNAERNLLRDLQVNEEELTLKLNGFVYGKEKKPLANATVVLTDPKGNKLETVSTDAKGRFNFKYLKADLADGIEVSGVNDSVVFLYDHKGRRYLKMVKGQDGKFTYKLLSADKDMLGDYMVDDPWLNAVRMQDKTDTLVVTERIFYEVNGFKPDSAGKRALDKAITILKANPELVVEIGSHTDSRANDVYNLELSNKRAKYAVDYIVSKGINRKRLKAVGYGETKLLNKCDNASDCSDADHALNRRTEFKISSGSSK